MAHFALLNEENNVIEVHCAGNHHLLDADGNESEEKGIAFLHTMSPGGRYKQTSYNTSLGVHQLGGIPLRANYCGTGWQYSPEHDIFHPQQPYPSWTLDTVKGEWRPPVPRPDIEEDEDGRPLNLWKWNEDSQQWDEMND